MSERNEFLVELESVVNDEWVRIKKGEFWRVAKASIEGKKPAIFVMLMQQIYHFTRHNAINQAVATLNTNSKQVGLLRFALNHALEELGHEKMAFHDLKGFGVYKAEEELEESEILPATQAFISYLYFVSMRESLTARLGYSFWAENSYQHFQDLLAAIKEAFGLANKDMTFFVAHNSIDVKHAAEVEEAINKWVVSDQDRAKCREVAKVTLYLTGCILEQIAQKVAGHQHPELTQATRQALLV